LPLPAFPVSSAAAPRKQQDGELGLKERWYVTKEGAWWGVKLVGQRHPAFKDFKLE
jgi:hypothetical protein